MIINQNYSSSPLLFFKHNKGVIINQRGDYKFFESEIIINQRSDYNDFWLKKCITTPMIYNHFRLDKIYNHPFDL